MLPVARRAVHRRYPFRRVLARLSRPPYRYPVRLDSIDWEGDDRMQLSRFRGPGNGVDPVRIDASGRPHLREQR